MKEVVSQKQNFIVHLGYFLSIKLLQFQMLVKKYLRLPRYVLNSGVDRYIVRQTCKFYQYYYDTSSWWITIPLYTITFFFGEGELLLMFFFKFLEQFIFMVGKILTLIDRRGQFGSVKEFLCQFRRTTSAHNDHMTLAWLSQ